MNVLFLAWNFPPAVGGIEHVAHQVFRGLQARGHAARALARFAAPTDTDPAVARPPRAGLTSYLLFSWTRGWGAVRRFRPDVIVCPGIVDAPLGWLLSAWFRVPLILLAHGSDLAHGGVLFRAVVRFLFRRADRVAANSASTMRMLEEGGCPASRIRIIHPGVDPAFAQPRDPAAIRARHRLAAGPVLLTAGRLIRRKGILEFIEHVLPGLCARHPGLVYVLAGGDAAQSLAHQERLLDRIRRRVEELRLQEHVRILGEVHDDELRELYAAADLFVLPAIPMPNDVEGFGIVLLEAALSGLPAVAARLGGIPEAVEQGVGGLLVEPLDWSGFAQAVERVLADPALRRTLSAGGRQRALDRFVWPVIVAQYEQAMRDAVAVRAGEAQA